MNLDTRKIFKFAAVAGASFIALNFLAPMAIGLGVSAFVTHAPVVIAGATSKLIFAASALLSTTFGFLSTREKQSDMPSEAAVASTSAGAKHHGPLKTSRDREIQRDQGQAPGDWDRALGQATAQGADRWVQEGQPDPGAAQLANAAVSRIAGRSR